MTLSHSVRALLPSKSLIKEGIGNLVINSEKMKFVSSYIVYKENNGAIVMATSKRMTTTQNHIAVKYYWFRHHVGKAFVIWKIKSENQKAYIFTKGLQVELFPGLGSCYAVGKPSGDRKCSKK